MTEQTIGTVNVTGGGASIQLDTSDLAVGSYTIRALYNENNTYRGVEDTGTLTVQQQQLVDPWSGLLDSSNWGSYPNASSGTGQTGNTTTLTSSDYTLNSTSQYLEFKTTKYYVYNQTLADLLDYYNDEFSIIVYKGGGDGWFDMGFVNTTTGGYKLGYISCISRSAYARNQENNVNISLGSSRDFPYSYWNECTFSKEGSDLVLYWRGHGSTYTSQAIALGSIDPEKYYFYVKGCTRNTVRVSVNSALIQNPSRDPNE
jgi:hypothetical protein